MSEDPASGQPHVDRPDPGPGGPASPLLPRGDEPAGLLPAGFMASTAPDFGSLPGDEAPAGPPEELTPRAASGSGPEPAGPTQPVSPPPPALPVPTHTGSLLLAIMSGLGLLVAGGIGAVLILLGLGSLTGASASQDSAGVLLTFGWISLLVAILQLPALVLSIRRLSGRSGAVGVKFPRRWFTATIGVVLTVPLVLLGQSLADQATQVSTILLPPLQLVVVALPVWWVLETGRRGLNAGSAQRGWGIASVGTLITMPLIIILEGVSIILAAILGFSWLSAHPQALQDLQTMFRAMSGSGINSSQASEMLGPLLSQPGIIFLFFLYLSIIGPLIEETFKPLALWFLAGRNLTPTQGFTAGLVGGATFALLESLSNIYPALGSEWASTVAVRVVAALLHITFSGLVGLGLALAWRRGKYLQLGGLFLLAVALHGLWNGVSLLSGLTPLLDSAQYGVLVWLGQFSNIFMVVLAAVILALLLGVNRYLRTHPDEEAPAQVINPVNTTQLTTETHTSPGDLGQGSHREDI